MDTEKVEEVSCLVCGYATLQDDRAVLHEPSGQFVCVYCRDAGQYMRQAMSNIMWLRERIKEIYVAKFATEVDRDNALDLALFNFLGGFGLDDMPEVVSWNRLMRRNMVRVCRSMGKNLGKYC